ncbi:glycosyltransferase family 2 protein [Klebsiella pasteurii]|uniref:glycosyltransferase family 2 protein n=1 Tax=Klebsiella TaxID=570 RepID=UPI0009E5C57F|nr:MULTISPECIES: glycosyltransferase family 2 protein [Klebsiella]MDS7915281.1 glycosyltransferase family 2 protein [Klebsiella pasteurii]OQR48894.1 hypothetical protein BI322_07700 [Klebsiella oxytoca]
MKNSFKIYALMTVKNEADIVIEALEHASLWADKIFVIDNNSSDSTFSLIREYANVNPKIIIWGQYGGAFYLGLRQVLFKDYREIAKEGDWWCRLDGDEFYIDDPRDFLSAIPDNFDHVYNASFQYYFTYDDYINEKNSLSSEISVLKRLEWYKCNHSEIRFVKHTNLICWPQLLEWPCNLRYPYSKRIRLKHYQYRSINQIDARLALRNAPDSGTSFTHEKVSVEQWYSKRKFTAPDSEELKLYRVVNNDDLTNSSDFKYNDEELPPVRPYNYKKKIRNFMINFYMSFMNKYFFKI